MKLLQVVLLATTAVLSACANPSLRAESDGVSVTRRDEALEYMATMIGGPYCRIENGYDFVDNDIGNAWAAAAEDCCALCNAFSGCKAFSWTDFNGGTCWFKSGRGQVVVNSKVKSSILMASTYVPNCNIESGTDYVGNDISNAAEQYRVGCCQQCAMTPGCRAYTSTAGWCWFKSAKGRMVVNPNAYSAEPYPTSAEAQCGLEQGVDYVGNDIGSVAASKASDCCAKCQTWNGCRAFSWTNQNGGTCWLKNLKGDTKANANVISAAVFPNPPAPSCSLETGVDYVGNDVGNAPSSDAYGCCSICMKRSDCKAFSWTDQNGGTCWLKSGKGVTKADPKVKSSII